MHKIANFITSVRAITIAMILIIIAMVFDSQTLFIRALPADMMPWAKQVTSWAMSIGFEVTVLLTTANANHIRKSIKYILALCTFVMTLFFFEAFNQVDVIIQFRTVFVSALIAYVNFIYSELFVAKWNQYLAQQDRNQQDKETIKKLLQEGINLRNQCDANYSIIESLNNTTASLRIQKEEYELQVREFAEKLMLADQEIEVLKGKLSRSRKTELA